MGDNIKFTSYKDVNEVVNELFDLFHSLRTENKLKSHEKVYKNKDVCGIVMLSEKDIVLEFNQYMKSDKMSYIIYGDIEFLIKKIDGCLNNPEIGEHIVDIQCQQFGHLIT